MSENQTMYAQNKYWPDVFKGCKNNCVYCKPSFQRQAKRQLHTCKVLDEKGTPKCYTFAPHFHIERMKGKTPKTAPGQFIFFPKGGDLCYASPEEFELIIKFIESNSQTTFLIQTKCPEFLLKYDHFPTNLILGITLETDMETFCSASRFKSYSEISQATCLLSRAAQFLKVKHNRKIVTVEPILQHNQEVLVYWIKEIHPEAVYVGYDTKKCLLPEPKLDETLSFIKALEAEGLTVRRKTIRQAWWEKRQAQLDDLFTPKPLFDAEKQMEETNKKVNATLEPLLRQSRKMSVNIIMTTQQPANLSGDGAGLKAKSAKNLSF